MLPGQRETRHWEIVRMLGPRYLPILYFVFSRKLTEMYARELARRCPDDGFTKAEDKEAIKQAVDKFDADYPKVMTSEQEAMYIKGVAFHHAGLSSEDRRLVERLFTEGLLWALCCTAGLAQAPSLPPLPSDGRSALVPDSSLDLPSSALLCLLRPANASSLTPLARA